MYRINRKGFSISADEVHQYSTGLHRAKEKAIFYDSFVNGYHGGTPFSENNVLIPQVPNGFRPRPYDDPYNKP